jgi:uncharacterized membrane-anchored protein
MSAHPTAVDRQQSLAVKVPAITALFWLVKLLSTGMGEAASDFLGEGNLVVGGAVGVLGFAGALWLQLRSRRYIAPVYWLAVVMVAVFGTMAADVVHVALDVPYPLLTLAYAVLLAAVFVLWHRTEGTLSIHSIDTRRRELWYWATVLLTFALGTAAGDLTAASLHLGFAPSAVVFAVAILVPAVGWWRLGLNSTLAFWTAYVLTRPLGASLADWLGKPHRLSGVGWGDGTVTLGAGVLIVALVGYLWLSRRDVQPAVRTDLEPDVQPAG